MWSQLPPVAGFSLSNYISVENVCDWTGKREAELRVAETESISGERSRGGRKAVDTYPRGVVSHKEP